MILTHAVDVFQVAMMHGWSVRCGNNSFGFLVIAICQFSQGGGSNTGWRVSPLHEVEEETAIDDRVVPLPPPSNETAEEIARRLRTTLKSGEYLNEYKDLVAVKAASAPVQSA